MITPSRPLRVGAEVSDSPRGAPARPGEGERETLPTRGVLVGALGGGETGPELPPTSASSPEELGTLDLRDPTAGVGIAPVPFRAADRWVSCDQETNESEAWMGGFNKRTTVVGGCRRNLKAEHTSYRNGV